MVTVQLNGRLGNQLFQIGAASSHAAKLGTTWGYLGTPAFGGKRPSTRPGGPTYREPRFAYDPLPNETDLHLEGYFQSWRYLTAACHRERLPLGDVTAVHVRRGDYATKPDYHPVLPRDYYAKALAMVEPRFIRVFTDDPEYARTVVPEADQIHGPNDVTAYEALFAMAYAPALIMANSSLSWHGAFKNTQPRTIIAPDPWFGPRGPQDTQDLLMPHWTVIRWR